jgi:hypothetical protein
MSTREASLWLRLCPQQHVDREIAALVRGANAGTITGPEYMDRARQLIGQLEAVHRIRRSKHWKTRPVEFCAWCPQGKPLVRHHPCGQPEHRP